MKKNTKKTRRSKRARPGGSISNPNEAPILGPAAERSPKGKEEKSPRGDCSNNRFNFADGLWKALRRDAHYAGNEIITHRALHTCIWIFRCFFATETSSRMDSRGSLSQSSLGCASCLSADVLPWRRPNSVLAAFVAFARQSKVVRLTTSQTVPHGKNSPTGKRKERNNTRRSKSDSSWTDTCGLS